VGPLVEYIYVIDTYSIPPRRKEHAVKFRRLALPLARLAGIAIALCLAALAILVVSGQLNQTPANAATSYNVFLPLTMKNGTLASASAPTSLELIDRALASGAITAETALTYKVYAEFHDTRLPSQYQGDDSKPTPVASVMLELANKFPTLSRETQNLLAPFIMPPAYSGSWYDRVDAATVKPAAEPGPDPIIKTGWNTMGDGNVRVWWRDAQDQATAATVANAMNSQIWPSLIALFGSQPLSDAGPHNFVDLNGNNRTWGDGGDGRLDIYIIGAKIDGGAMTVAYPPGCKQRPAFMMIEGPSYPARPIPDPVAAATHEFVHAILFGYNFARECSEYDWLQEATGNWAIDYVYPDNNWEHRDNQCCQFEFPEDGLRRSAGYDAYIFPFYLSHKFSPLLIKTIWDNTLQYGNLEAVDKAIPGGFLERWPDFAVYLWNRAPFNDFSLWDKISEVAFGLGLTPRATGEYSTDVVIPVNLSGAKDAQYVMPADVKYLASNYYHFTFPDAAARSIEFLNPYISGVNPDGKVQALIKTEGQNWVREDWTASPFKTFCRDKKSERLEELVIILSNSDWEAGPPLDPVRDAKLVATNIGCWQWTGTASTTTYTQDALTNITDIVAAEGLRFERLRTAEAPGGNGTWELYETKPEGTANWSIQGTVSDCTYAGSATVAVQQGEGSIQIWNYETSASNYRYYTGTGGYSSQQPYTITCPGPPPVTIPNTKFIGGWLLAPAPEPRQISADGVTATGVLTSTVPGETTVYKWDLHAQREP